jgi:DNA-binding response OmpR family regulator
VKAKSKSPATLGKASVTGNHRVKVLLVEDSPTEVRLLEDKLAKVTLTTFEVTRAGKLAEALGKLNEHPFDIVLLDLNLPDSEELQTFTKVNRQNPEVPIVVLTGMNDEKLAIEAVSQGAEDYLIKRDTDHQLLGRAMAYAVERHRLQMERMSLLADQIRKKEREEQEQRSLEHLSETPRNMDPKTKELIIQNYTEALQSFITGDTKAPVLIAQSAADEFFKHKLSGKETVDIHLESVRVLTENLSGPDAQHFVEQSRFLIVGSLAHLTDLYRGKK